MIPHIGTPLPDRADRDWVTAHELAAEAGVSWAFVDRLLLVGFLQAEGFERFAVDQIPRARLVRHLFDAGLESAVRAVIDDLLAHGHARLGHLTLTLDDDGQPDGTGAA